LNPPDHQPTRGEFQLPERTLIPHDQLAAAMDAIQKKLDSWEIDFADLDEATKIYIQEQIGRYLAEVTVASDEKFQAAARLIGYTENFIALLDRERRYAATLANWNHYLEWKANRNPARAALEAKYGYDTKHGLHLVRLMRMCREILVDGVVHVRRPDADELREILNGAWDYDHLMAWAEEQDKVLIEIAQVFPLPKKPDREALDVLCRSIIHSFDDKE
jgi:hypothetical protein